VSTVALPSRTACPLLKRMVKTVREHRLFEPGQHLLIAISGGPDSIALASLLRRLASSWKLSLSALHVNYRLRGAESDEDESFVASFCRERGIPLSVRRPALVKRGRQSSLQARAREARYEALRQVAGELNADRIVLGHTANDQAETVLLWMLRGAGLAGLSGMPIARDGLIVRPLLEVTRQEILAYLKQEGLDYRQDSSNLTGRYRRNRIRTELLPAMEAIAPATLSLFRRQAALLRDDDHYLDRIARELYGTMVQRESDGAVRIGRASFRDLHRALQRRLIRLLLKTGDDARRAPSIQVVESLCRFIVKGKPEAGLLLKRFVVRLDRETVSVSPRDQTSSASDRSAPVRTEVPVPVPSTVRWAGSRTQFHVQLMSRQEAERQQRPASSCSAVFDADRLVGPLVLRSWRAGDRFYPRGMKGKSKKLQDLFTDLKIPKGERERVPLLVSPEGIAWVVGLRQDERFAVHKETTRCVVVTAVAP